MFDGEKTSLKMKTNMIFFSFLGTFVFWETGSIGKPDDEQLFSLIHIR